MGYNRSNRRSGTRRRRGGYERGPIVRGHLDELDIEGLFWLATKPNKKEAGRLRFDSTNGAELDLIGSFHELREFGEEIDEPIRIHGIAGKKLLTLDSCLRTNQQLEIPGIVRERYHVSRVLTGAQFSEDQPLDFNAVHLQLQHLDQWVWRSGVAVERTLNEHSTGLGQVKITVTPLGKIIAPLHIGDLELSFLYDFSSDPIAETKIKQRCSLGVKFTDPSSLQETLKICGALQDLLTIGVDSPSSITSLSLSYTDTPARIDLYAQLRGNPTPQNEKTIHPSKMLFTFDDIGGIDGIGQWLGVSNKFELVISSLLSHRYSPGDYVENRLLNVIIAAEALERIRLNQQNFNFKKGLTRLINYAGDPFNSTGKGLWSMGRRGNTHPN